MRRAFIYAAGRYTADDISLYKRVKLKEDDLIICADGGYDSLVVVGIEPHIIIGDMDSVRRYIPKNIPVIRHPRNKDKTDLHLCVDYALEQGCDEIILMGAYGNRIDHSLGAVITLRYILERGASAMLLTAHSRVYLIKDKITLNRESFDKISLIPMTERVEGVTTKGLRYSLSNYTLKQTENLGISNEFTAPTASVYISKGLLFVICEE